MPCIEYKKDKKDNVLEVFIILSGKLMAWAADTDFHTREDGPCCSLCGSDARNACWAEPPNAAWTAAVISKNCGSPCNLYVCPCALVGAMIQAALLATCKDLHPTLNVGI